MADSSPCSTCGQINESGAQNCSRCGKFLESLPMSGPLNNRPALSPVPKGGPDTGELLSQTFAPTHPSVAPDVIPVPQPFNGDTPDSPSSKELWWKAHGRLLILLVLIFMVILSASGFYYFHSKQPHGDSPIKVNVPTGLGEFTASNGDTIGVNDGSLAPFDGWRNAQELALKQQAAQKVHNDVTGAITSWNSALKIDSSDAEALIYEENQRVQLSGKPYFTLIACTAFVIRSDNSPQSQLQGIYVAQHELNSSSSPYKLRILIANSGSDENNAQLIAQQIVNIARKDHSVVGTIGWLTSSRSYASLTALSAAKIPQVSPQASEDKLSGISPYFFRVAPTNSVEGPAAAKFAEQILQVKNPVVFVDPNEPYSQNLAQDFEAQFVRDKYGQPHEETFTTDDKNNKKKFASLIQDAMKYNPDAFYFTSASVSDTGLFQDALPTSGPFAKLPVISGDAGYAVHPNSYNRWFFTSFSFADAWHLIVGKDTPPFFGDYSSDFNPDGLPKSGPYGFTRPDDAVILSYDATQVLLKGIQIAQAGGKTPLTAQDVAGVLSKITGAQAYQGISGQIAFDANHDPINKAIVFLYNSADGHLQMKSYQGCFIKGCPEFSNTARSLPLSLHLA